MLLFNRDSDGNAISMDSKLTPEDLKKGMDLEAHTSVLDRYLGDTDGNYGWQGMLSRGGNLTVPKAVLAGGLSQAERVERVRKRINRGEPPLLVSYDPVTDTPLFAEEDKEAYEDGYICPGCMQYQKVPNIGRCNWNRPAPVDTAEEMGCGYITPI